ncbi:hypothetical protein WJX81_000834 [Elliptochloris bilobata]|uniref:N-acetyltransferase domain-containing protein n=1 Tax=Elliptochloris bilobata TaxID=381761 RepID=A0AAW1RE93_9CHLO
MSALDNTKASTSGRQIAADSILYRQYRDETDLSYIMTLVDNELSEPYSIFTYRYFLHSWPTLCYMAFDGAHCFGTVVCKMDMHNDLLRGYIAMLVVEHAYRGLGVGTELVRRAIQETVAGGADEVVLEAEVTNRGALALYEGLGFLRDKRLLRYYLNGADAFRLKLMLPLSPERAAAAAAEQLASLSAGGPEHAVVASPLQPPGIAA